VVFSAKLEYNACFPVRAVGTEHSMALTVQDMPVVFWAYKCSEISWIRM